MREIDKERRAASERELAFEMSLRAVLFGVVVVALIVLTFIGLAAFAVGLNGILYP